MDLLLNQDEISWKTILYDLVRTENMDPWDVNITLLTQEYIKIVKKLREHDLKISGKVLLAAAILLKMKTSYLLERDITLFDSLMQETEEELNEEFLDEEEVFKEKKKKEQYQLIPRNPQPRNRKVSIHDLVHALQRAMISKKKILEKIRPVDFAQFTNKKIEIMEVIEEIYQKIIYYSKKEKTLTFDRLLPPRAKKQEKVYTFLPLLHLENQNKIEMKQTEAFAKIGINLIKKR